MTTTTTTITTITTITNQFFKHIVTKVKWAQLDKSRDGWREISEHVLSQFQRLQLYQTITPHHAHIEATNMSYTTHVQSDRNALN